MTLIQVKLLEGVFTAPQKQEIIERLTNAMVEIEGENMRRHIWCRVEEVANGDWGVGGQTLISDDVKSLARAQPAPRARRRLRESAMSSQLASALGSRSRPLARQPLGESAPKPGAYVLDPDGLGDHIDQLYRAAYALCGSRHDAEDLVQETFANVLKRPRLIRDDNEIGYLLRALRNTHANGYRTAARRPATRQLFEDELPRAHESDVNAREIMQAIASAPAPFRDAVIAIDVVGLSYREAARSLRTREPTIATRLHRGRQHVARQLLQDAPRSHNTPRSAAPSCPGGKDPSRVVSV